MAQGPRAAEARPWLCLPPVFDGGQRLHALPTPEVFWLELLLRQHELCWRAPATPQELRVALFGSSAVYGFPLPVEETFGGRLNEHFAADGIPARLFNLAFVNPYQVRDALLIHETLPYKPDVILYPLTLAELHHHAPMPFPNFHHFFDMNRAALQPLTETPPPGLEAPFARYRWFLANRAAQYHSTDQLSDVGLFARLAARAAAESITARFNAPRQRFTQPGGGRQTTYDCSDTELKFAKEYANWSQWNILAYLEELQRQYGIPVLVVHWPIAHEPVGVCYSVRYTNAAVINFVTWLRAETSARQLSYLDLHDLLPAELFIDSLHVSAEGHRRIADAVERVLDPMLRNLAAQRAEH